ncbi:putative methyl-accepting chemotaxis protein [Vibrio phage 230E39-1]|nr:putative methyl-accepting chemotaxis protein [Vibrio phage 230E39-1]
MASINLKGYLREPLGETSGGNKIVFTHVSTTGEVIAGSRTSYTVEANGYYDIDIEYGNVAIETSDLNSRSWQYHGTTTINHETTATTLPTLLNSFVPPSDAQIILFQDLVKDAEDARDASAASAVLSQSAAQSSINNSILMNEQQARAKNATNNNHFDASGMVHMGQGYTNGVNAFLVNEGLWTNQTVSNAIRLGRGVKSSGESKTTFAQTHIAGSVFNALTDSGDIPFTFLLPEAEGGTRTLNKATGESITHPDVDTAFALAATSDDIEVVTHPVDGVFLECWEEELTGVQEVMECIQSLSTTFGDTDVPTVLSTRKLSYFQQYDGQFPEVTANPDFINDRYRCVVWSNLTDEQKRKVAAYMGEKLFMGVNGNIVNGRLRARTIRGLGNGDWYTVASTAAGSACLQSGSDASTRVGIQAHRDSPLSGSAVVSNFYAATGNTNYNADPQVGAFTSRYKQDYSASYMYVVATVPRANKGAYHPDLNSWGTAGFINLADTGVTHWYNSDRDDVHTPADCFDFGDYGQGKKVHIRTGAIADGLSCHPDGIFYDDIEAGGLNGVIDWRLGAVANDSPAETSKTLAKVENGTYRGLEKLVWSTPYGTDYTGTASHTDGARQVYRASDSGGFVRHVVYRDVGNDKRELKVGDKVACYNATLGVTISGVVFSTGATFFYLDSTESTLNVGDSWAGDSVYVIIESETNLSVSGEFNTQMVIGDPANILQDGDIKDGWLGTWCSTLPGATADMPLTRKCLSASLTQVARDVASAGGWASTTKNVNTTTNTISFSGTNWVALLSYKALAKQTKPSTNKPVYNGKAGLMDVISTQANQQSTLSESLIGKVLKSSGANLPYGTTNALTDFTIIDAGYTGNESLWGKLGELAGQYPNHTKLRLGKPINNSPAIKALPYQISNNGQGSIGFQANELTWDDSITILPYSGTNTGWTVGQLVLISSGEFRGFYRVIKSGATLVSASVYGKGLDGHIYNRDNKEMYFEAVDVTKLGWGDDDIIKITADGSDTFVDLNGNTNLSVVHELAIPCTWTSNRARAGEQVEGVDL